VGARGGGCPRSATRPRRADDRGCPANALAMPRPLARVVLRPLPRLPTGDALRPKGRLPSQRHAGASSDLGRRCSTAAMCGSAPWVVLASLFALSGNGTRFPIGTRQRAQDVVAAHASMTEPAGSRVVAKRTDDGADEVHLTHLGQERNASSDSPFLRGSQACDRRSPRDICSSTLLPRPGLRGRCPKPDVAPSHHVRTDELPDMQGRFSLRLFGWLVVAVTECAQRR
jgi:hypothetical protein